MFSVLNVVLRISVDISYKTGVFPSKTISEEDGWMICDITSFSSVSQSYQDDGWVIMNGCVLWNLIFD